MTIHNEGSAIKRRLIDICEELSISGRSFSKEIGKSENYIANLNKDITSSVLNNIRIAYPMVNIMRIITGEGPILVPENNNPVNNDEISSLQNKIIELEREVKNLIRENGKLEGKIEILTEPSVKSVG